MARLLDGPGGFLPSGAPTVPTRRTRALESRRELEGTEAEVIEEMAGEMYDDDTDATP